MLDMSKYKVKAPKRLPVIFLIDVSGSMGEVIDETGMRSTGRTCFVDGKLYNIVEGGVTRINVVNKCCSEMIQDFAHTENLETEIDTAIITFGKQVLLHQSLQSASSIQWTDMDSDGDTPLGEAIDMAKNMIEDKSIIPSRSYRPVVILVSDGRPDENSHWESSLHKFLSEGRSAKCDRIALGIGDDADKDVLGKFIEGTGRSVFSASDSKKIIDFFKFVTMTVTQQATTIVPKKEQGAIADDKNTDF